MKTTRNDQAKLLRYERQLFFKYIGKEGQEKISKATATIVGLGALGSTSAELLCRAGIGKLILIDDDTVELHNLQRQSLYDESDIAQKKVRAAEKHLKMINKECMIEVHDTKIKENNLALLKNIIIDGTDTMQARYLLNRVAVQKKISFIYGAVASSVGMLYVVEQEKACLSCIFPNTVPLLTCEVDGVLNTICNTIASVQAMECLKLILGEPAEKDLIRINLWKNEWEHIRVKKRSDCSVCGKEKHNLSTTTSSAKNTERFIIRKCRSKAAYALRERSQQKINLDKTRSLFDPLEIATRQAFIGIIDDEAVIVHPQGEILFKTCTDTEKMKKIAAKIFD